MAIMHGVKHLHSSIKAVLTTEVYKPDYYTGFTRPDISYGYEALYQYQFREKLEAPKDFSKPAQFPLEDNGSNASRMLLALQVASRANWINPVHMCVSRGTHSFNMQNNLIKVHVNCTIPGGSILAVLQRPLIGHLCIDGYGNIAYPVASNIIAAMANLHTLTVYDLTTGYYSNNMYSILKDLPSNCTTLSLSRRNVQIKARLERHLIPSQIKVLKLEKIAWDVYTESSQLEIVRLHECDSKNVILPITVRKLYITKSLRLPTLNYGLKVLDLSKSDITTDFVYTMLPVTVRVLKLPKQDRYAIKKLPPTLVYLDVGQQFTQRIVCTLPSTLQTFVMHRSMTHYTHSLTGKLPNGLKTLIVNALLHSLGTLPSCLEQLYYSNCTAALPALPRTLRKLYISSSRFNAPLGKLPVTLTELDLGTATAFKQQLEALPVALKTLTLHAEYQQPLLQLATTTKVIGVRLHADQRTTVQRTRMILPRGIAVLTQAAADEQLELREALILAQQMQDVVAIEVVPDD
eukprot:4125-Heterococcus_DN1.PRE.1